MEMPSSDSHFVLRWLLSGIAVLLTSKLVSGFQIRGFVIACVAAIVIGLANTLLWPILIFLTLPINLLTLGLFTFVVNGAILKISAALVPGFRIDTWWTAIVASIVLSIIGMILHFFFF